MRSDEPLDPQQLQESYDLECKTAGGRDGRGALPDSFWETYSAMANTVGGVVLLGVREVLPQQFVVTGVADHNKVRTALFNGLNDRDKVSVGLLDDRHVTVHELDGKHVIRIDIPRARREQRPVYIGPNPLTGTYRRRHAGDYKCDRETVRQMLADQVHDSRDARILDGFGFGDLDRTTLGTYRQRFRITKPDHLYNEGSDPSFLRSIGGLNVDRETGQEGLTLAGLLMFGRLRSILDACPNYMLDYQEQLVGRSEVRWVDRLNTDGSWSGNLFDFYREVIQRLVKGLAVPFRREGDQRIDDSHIHQALREALVNSLVHADYDGRLSILIAKRPDLFGFRNPGTMRVPIETAIEGGESDCRNRNLHLMFQLVGLGERAGSGIPKIYAAWREQSWRAPLLRERDEPSDQVVLTLRPVSLLQPEVVAEMEQRFGSRFGQLSEFQRLAVITAATEGEVTNRRLQSLSTMHRSDITAELGSLRQTGFLVPHGATSGTAYYLAGEDQEQQQGSVFEAGTVIASSDHSGGSIDDKDTSLDDSDEASAIDQAPPIQDFPAEVRIVRNKRRATHEQLHTAIVAACRAGYIDIVRICAVLDRKEPTIRPHVRELVDEGLLELRFPAVPTHPQQAYCARDAWTPTGESDATADLAVAEDKMAQKSGDQPNR